MKICLIGSTEYLGEAYLKLFKSLGVEVICPANWKLGDDITLSSDIDLLMHASWNIGVQNEKESREINELGSKKLIDEAVKNKTKIIFISSISAFSGCISVYGKSKLAVEKMVLENNGIVIRPGLIWSHKSLTGVLEKFYKLINFIPVIPYISKISASSYLINREELCEMTQEIIKAEALYEGTIITVAYPKEYNLKKILETMALKNSKKRIFVGLPLGVISSIISLMSKFKLSPFKLDSLTGFTNANPNPIINKAGKIDFLKS